MLLCDMCIFSNFYYLSNNIFSFLANFLFLSFLLYSNAFASQEFIDLEMNIKVSNNNLISKEIGDDLIIKGSIEGKAFEKNEDKINDIKMSCDLLGRAYTGRGFSCGFGEVEEIKGYCHFYDKTKNSFIAYIDCITTSGLNGDVACVGKTKILKGFGKYSAVIGFGKIEMPLAKSIISNNISYPLKAKFKIKFPKLINKDQQALLK